MNSLTKFCEDWGIFKFSIYNAYQYDSLFYTNKEWYKAKALPLLLIDLMLAPFQLLFTLIYRLWKLIGKGCIYIWLKQV